MMQNESQSRFYVYFWLRCIGTPYYVGKGTDDRAFYQHERRFGPPSRDRILIQYYESEADAFVAERFFIEFYGRKLDGTGCLWNVLDGGIGGISQSVGNKRSPEHCKHISEALKGNTIWRGKHHSEETKKKMSDAQRGRKLSIEHCRKISEYLSTHPGRTAGKRWTWSEAAIQRRVELNQRKRELRSA